MYENIISKNASDSTSLAVISGYTSPSILRRIISDFPTLKITLYIGMALEGISIHDHSEYMQLMENNPQLTVYYKIKYPLNHMKIYQFATNDHATKKFVGSANLSNAGFEYNQEILLQTDSDFTHLFKETHLKSMLCTDEKIKQHILFYDDEKAVNIPSSTPVVLKDDDQTDEKTNQGGIKETYALYKKFAIRSMKYASEADFIIPILLENDVFQMDKGINAWVRNQTPHLRQSPKYPFRQYFPINTEFNILTESGENLVGKLSKGKTTQLEIYPSIYEYLKRKLSLQEHRPIEYADLLQFDMVEIWGIKMDENQYYFDFSPKNVVRRSNLDD